MGHSVEFDGRVVAAFQDHVDLGVLLVKVSSRFTADLSEMNGAREFLPVSKCPASHPTWALHWGDLRQVNYGRWS